jgi:hypothetical protein
MRQGARSKSQSSTWKIQPKPTNHLYQERVDNIGPFCLLNKLLNKLPNKMYIKAIVTLSYHLVSLIENVSSEILKTNGFPVTPNVLFAFAKHGSC